MNRLITPDEFAADVMAAMVKVEDEAGIPRGSIVRAFVAEFNKQFDADTKEKP